MPNCYLEIKGLWLSLTLLISSLLSAQTLASWLPNVVHFTNHSPQMEPRQPAMQMPQQSIDGSFVIEWAMYDYQSHQFLLEYQLVGDDNWQVLYQGSNTQFSTSSLWTGGQYNIRISCANDEYCPIDGYLSDSITLIDKPQQPVLNFTSNQVLVNNSYELSFFVDDNVDSYKFFENDQLIDTILLSEGQLIITLAKSKPEVDLFHYQLQACNTAGCSELSAEATIEIYLPAAVPLPATFPEKAYPINNNFQVLWPQVTEGLNYQYFTSSYRGKEINSEQIYNQAISVTEEQMFTFAEPGYIWFFAKGCDVTGKCSDYSEPAKIQIYTRPTSAPVFSASLYGQPVDDNAQVISVPLAKDDAPWLERFALHWSPVTELAPNPTGYYNLEVNGIHERFSYESLGYYLYPDNLNHREMNHDTAGRYVYTIQACNRITDVKNVAIDCGPKSTVIIYAGMPVPDFPVPGAAITNFSATHDGDAIDGSQTIMVEPNQTFLLHWQELAELELYPVGYYAIFIDGTLLRVTGSSDGVKSTTSVGELYPDDLYHREFSLDTPGTYQYTIAGFHQTENGREYTLQSPPVTVVVKGTSEAVQAVSISRLGDSVDQNQQSITIDTGEQLVIHWQELAEQESEPHSFYSIVINSSEMEPTTFKVDNVEGAKISPSLEQFYQDDLFHFQFAPTLPKILSITIAGCIDTESGGFCGPASKPVEVIVKEQTFIASPTVIKTGEYTELNWQQPKELTGKVYYNLYVDKPDGSARVHFGKELTGLKYSRLINMASKHTFYLEACPEQGQCLPLQSVKVTAEGIGKVSAYSVSKSSITLGDSVSLQWQPPYGFTGTVYYNLRAEKAGGDVEFLLEQDTKGQYSLKLDSVGTYLFHVQACNSLNECGPEIPLPVNVLGDSNVIIHTKLLGMPVIH